MEAWQYDDLQSLGRGASPLNRDLLGPNYSEFTLLLPQTQERQAQGAKRSEKRWLA